jgi:Bacterial Ig domain
LGNSTGDSGATVSNGQDGGTGTVWVAADIFGGGCDQAAGTWNDGGDNVGSDTSCFAPTPASTDDDTAGSGLGSLLGPLANNGGPTETVLPLPGNPGMSIVPDGTSVSLDGTSVMLCPTTDQRGVASEPGQACDAGSVQESPPIAMARSFSTGDGAELTEPARTLQSGVVDFNPGATTWTAQLTATASDGTVVIEPDGLFTYTPKDGFVGTDTFSYTLTDNLGYTPTPATVTLVVSGAPPATTSTIPTASTPLTATAAPPVAAPATTDKPAPSTTSPPKPFPHSGTDGEVHGFSTGHQLSSDGNDPALVVTVPSLGSLKVGSAAGAEGTAASALSTRADGAIVNSSGTYYVLAGGRAFGISSPPVLARVQKADKARVLMGSVGTAEKAAAIAGGVLLSTAGRVYVSYSGALYVFKTTAQLDRDGYGGTTAVTVPGTAGLTVVSSCSGT